MAARLIPAHAGKTTQSYDAWLFYPAHPRSRGENGSVRICLHSVTGSSPLTRGKPSSCTLRPRTARLIPAHAGKTASVSILPSHESAHPRSRGENSGNSSNVSTSVGSSPLTRGKPPLRRRRQVWEGLIPAHAGKTPRLRSGPQARTAHPRSRGENSQYHLIRYQTSGSSPLTRGKRDRDARPWRAVGLIPAHAGKTPWSLARTSAGRAHPRSRGENPTCRQ